MKYSLITMIEKWRKHMDGFAYEALKVMHSYPQIENTELKSINLSLIYL